MKRHLPTESIQINDHSHPDKFMDTDLTGFGKRYLRILTRCVFVLILAVGYVGIVNGQFAVTTNGGSGLAPTYASLAAAITALNAATITSPVVITCPTGTETAPAGGYGITATGTISNTITIIGNGAANSVITAFTPQVTGSAASSFDAVFKIIGGDYITIQGFAMNENAGNTVITPGTTNTMTEFGVLLVHASATDGAQNNTIQNNSITLNSTYTNSVGIFSTSSSSSVNAALDATSTGGTNSNNKIYGNTISNVAYGIEIICPPITATVFETGNDIGGTSGATANTITFGNATASSGPWNRSQSTVQAGIYYRNGAGNSIRFNAVTSNSAAYVGSGGLNGIMISSGTAPTGVTYTSTISDNTVNVTTTGVALITGIDFGHGISTGTIVGSNNNVTVNQTSTAANSAVAIGIKANYASATNTCNSNTVVLNLSETTGALSGTATGITIAGTSTTNTANSNNITINQTGSGTGTITGGINALSVAGAATTINALTNTILINQTTSVATGISSAISGILANAIGTTVNVTTNNAITVKQAVTGAGTYGTGTVTYINVSAASGTINVTGNNLNTTGSTIRSTGALIGVFQDATVTVLVNIKNNTMNVDRVAASGSIIFQATSGTPSEVLDTVSNNTITFTNLAGTTSATAISSLGGPSSPVVNNKKICNNTINISGTNTGTTIGITCAFTNTGQLKGNSVTINCAATTVTGITTTGTVMTFTGNTISLTTSGTSLTSIQSIVETGTGAHSISNNILSTVNCTGVVTGSPTITGITISSGTIANVNNNTINNISVGAATSSASPVIDGLLISGGTGVNAFKNKIYDISTASTGASTIISGIRISGGGATNPNNISNNLIGNLTASAATSTDAIRGINITSTTTTTTNNVYYNTVYLSGGGGTNFGATGIFHAASSTATTATLNLRNNIIVNNTTPNGTGLAVAYRRSSGAAGTLANYAITSNNNLFFTGTLGGSANQLIYSDGTSIAQTMAAYKSGAFTAGTISPRDATSFTENPTFISTTGSSSNFLHINASVPTQIESGGSNIPTFTDDFDGDVRNVSIPDIGADEFAGIGIDLSPPVISAITLVGNACDLTSRNVTATISDATGVDNAGFQPRIYFRKNGGSYFSAAGTLTSGTVMSGTWTFTITYATVGGVVATNTIDYFLVAQDVAGTPNVGGNPSAGLVLTDVNTVSTPPTTPLTYTIQNSLSGSYTVGILQTYPTITAAIAAYNTSCLAGPVTFLLINAAYTEAAAMTINANPDASATNTLTIKPTAPNTTIAVTGGSASAIFILNGADYVIIDGSFVSTPNTVCPVSVASRDLTITNTNAGTSSAVIWLQTATADGATNNKIMNCNLVGNSNTTTLFGVGSGSSTISTSSLGTGNNNNSFVNNNISKTQYGIYSQGASAANKNTGNIINQNLVNAISPNNVSKGGIVVGFENNILISGNNISEIAQSSSPDVFGITLGTLAISTSTFTGNEVTNAVVSKNIIGSIRNTGTFSACGICIVPAATGINQISNNMISGVSANGTSGDFSVGVLIGGGAGSTQVYYNSITMVGTQISGSDKSFALAIGGANPIVDIRNNILVNTQNNGTGNNYAIGYGYSTFTNLTSDHNDYFVTTPGSTFFIGGTGSISSPTTQLLISNLQTATGKDGNAQNVNPAFIAPALHIDPANPINAPLDNGGTSVSVTDDIDCQSRATDIGADEFMATGCTGAVAGTANASPAGPFCGSGSSTITAVGFSTGAGSTYLWQKSISPFTTWTDIGIASASYSNLSTGSITTTTQYRLKVTCPTGTAEDYTAVPVTVTVNPLPATVVVTGGGFICGSSTTLLASNGGDGIIYYQGITSGGMSTATPSTSQMISSPGTYYFRALSAAGCWGIEGSATVTFVTAPSTTGVTICSGGSGSLTSSSCTGFTASGNTFTGAFVPGTDPIAKRPSTSIVNTPTCSFDASITRNYQAIQFQVSLTGTYTFDMTSTDDGMAYTYTGAFTPGTCGTWIVGDDDSGPGNDPELIATFTAGVTYTLISTTWSSTSGTSSAGYSWTVTPPGGGALMLSGTVPPDWYTMSSGGMPIGSGTSFNPVGVGGSPLTDTNTPGTTTFYAACPSAPDCRAGANFVINQTPTITLGPNPSVCQATSPAILTYTATTGTPSNYSIDFDVTAEGQGFVDVPITTSLPPLQISITVPGGAVAGTYNATLNVKNTTTTCSSISYPITVTIYPLPTVTFTGLAPMYCINASAVTLTGNHAPSGTFSGDGVTDNLNGTATFNPSGAGTGTHTNIKYSYTDGNGCSSSQTKSATVNALPVVMCPTDFSLCAGGSDFNLLTLTYSPVGGTFTGTGVTGNTFSPSTTGAGMYTITYSYTDPNGCSNSCPFVITVNPIPEILCPDPFEVSLQDIPFTLLTGLFSNGNYSGDGISANVFSPANAGLGVHLINHTYTDGNGCTNSCSFNLTVVPTSTEEDTSTMHWVFLPPGTNGTCVSNSDCCTDVFCYGLEYTPEFTGDLTNYTTGFIADCVAGNTPVLSNTSCIMTDNSFEIDDCTGSGLVLIDDSGFDGLVPVTAGVPLIIHQVCFLAPVGATITVVNDTITDLTTGINLAGGGFVTDYPQYDDTLIISRPPPAVPPFDSSYIECNANAIAPTPPVVSDMCGNIITPTGPVISGTYAGCEGTHIFTYTYTDCSGQSSIWKYTYYIDHITNPSEFGGPVPTSVTVSGTENAVPPTLPVVKDVCGVTLTGSLLSTVDTPDPIICAGTRVYTYRFTDCSGLNYDWVFTYTINNHTTLTCPEPMIACVSDPAFALTGESPAGGTYSGTGVSGDVMTGFMFDPAVAGPGVHPISYTYTNTYNCTDICTFNITVNSATECNVTSSVTWVFLPPGQNGTCTSNTNCCSDILCYGMQYTPGYTGTLTTYTTGFFANCVTGMSPVLSNTSCVMNNNSFEIGECNLFDLVLFNSSANTGDVDVTAGVPLIIHQVCFSVPVGAALTVTEDEVTEIAMSLDLVGGGFVTEYPVYNDYTVTRDPPVLPADGFSTVECLSSVVDPGAPTGIIDQCGNPLTGVFVATPDVPDPLTCEGTRTFTYRFTDCSGQISDWHYVYTIDHTILPTEIGGPVSISGGTVECVSNATPPATLPVVKDGCGNTLTPTAASPVIGGTYTGCEGTYTYTYHYLDCSGLPFTWTYSYNIDHTTNPAESGGPVSISGGTVECVSAATAPLTLPVVKDVCGNTLTPTIASPVIGGTYAGCEGTYTYTYHYNDCSGLPFSWTYTYNIDHVTNPAEVGGPVSASGGTIECVSAAIPPSTLPVVKDVCGNTLTPDIDSPVIGGTYVDCEGTYTYTYNYTDCAGLPFSWTYTYTIDHSTDPAEIGGPVSTTGGTVECASAATPPAILPVVKDVCGNTLVPTLSSPTNGGSYEGCEGTYTYVYHYVDCSGLTFNWTYTYNIDHITDPSEFEGPVSTSGGTVECVSSATPPLTLPVVHDVCGNILSPSLDSPLIGGTYTDCEGTYTYTYNYSDCSGLPFSWTYTYTIVHITNPGESGGPVSSSGGTVECVSAATAPAILPVIKDVCGNTLTPDIDSPVIGGTYVDCEGTYTYTYNYNDCAGLPFSWTYSYDITHVTNPSEFGGPVATSGGTVECINAISPPVTLPVVKDVCGNTLTPTVTSPVPGGTYDGCEGTATFTYNYADCAGLPFSWTYTYNVQHNTTPTEIGGPVSTSGGTVACVSAATPPVSLPVIKDVCGNTLSPTMDSPMISGTYTGCGGTYIYTYNYLDCAGLPFSWTYTYDIEIVDFMIPPPGAETVTCPMDINVLLVTPPSVTDNCGNTLTPSGPTGPVNSPNPLTCGGTVTYTWTYLDCAGNSHAWDYVYTINCQSVSLKVYLEGSYDTVGDTMFTKLNTAHVLPGQNTTLPFVPDTPSGQPYSGAPWNYNGTTGLVYGDPPFGTVPYPKDVVDWVLVTVRKDSIKPSNNIWRCAGWVHKDGEVTFPENCPFPPIDPLFDYYIMVEHRNHLGVMTPGFPATGADITCAGLVLRWDFTAMDSYKPFPRVGEKFMDGIWAMFAANGDQSQAPNSPSAINSPDLTLWRTQQNTLGYKLGDFNMNVSTNSADETIWKINQNKTSGIIFY